VRRKVAMVILFLLSLFFMWLTYSGIEYKMQEQNLTQQLQEKVTVGYLDEYILEAIEQERFDDVAMYQNLAVFLAKDLSSITLSQIEAHNGTLERSWRNIKSFTSGFINGEAESSVELSGSIASDLTLYGDLRDAKKEGSKYLDNEPYDAFILNISLLGIGLSASQLFSAGASTPLKIGTSVIKAAKKSAKLTKPFSKVLQTKLSKTVDTKILKKLDVNSLFKFEETINKIATSIDIKPVKSLFDDVNIIKQNTSLTDTIELMKYVDTPKELKSIGKISSQYKTNTKGVMKVLGKGAVRTGKSVMKFTMKFITKIIGLFLSLLGFFVVVIMKLRSLKHLKSIVS